MINFQHKILIMDLCKRFGFLFILILTVGCKQVERNFRASSQLIQYEGRYENLNDTSVALIGSGSVEMNIVGDTCTLFLSNGVQDHSYVALEVNQEYKGRFLVDGSPIGIKLPSSDTSNVKIYKATEASTGDVIFNKVSAKKLIEVTHVYKPIIEFIGNSITCGMGAQTEEIPCDTGEWYDQHNSYLAYGPRTARALNCDYRLSCVSGMGMYRNWNDEEQPVMPDVYKNLRLNSDTSKKITFESKPDLVSIALGTNDLSLGDGKKDRSGFDQKRFISNYTDFVKMIFDMYPETKVVMLTSPMIGEREQRILLESLKIIQQNMTGKPVYIFEFAQMEPNGCGGHPNLRDHRKMAEQLIPFLGKLFDN